LAIDIKARNGTALSLSYLYWGWIRHIAKEEGVTLPQSGSSKDSLSEDDAKKLAAAIGARAEKIRKGVAPRDAGSFVRQMDEQSFGSKNSGTVRADFDDPDSMDKTAGFFDLSGGVTIEY
jgi:hypothetical protein